jgi:hypothetical protein
MLTLHKAITFFKVPFFSVQPMGDVCFLLMYKFCTAQGSYNAFNLVLSLTIFTLVIRVVLIEPAI